MTYLLTPLLDDGIEHTNFFDGRLLTAAALETEQHAAHHHQRALGEAIGDGVANGLFVTLMNSSASTPQVQVAAGLALNRDGQTLRLPTPTTLTLHEPSPPATTTAETGLFHVCAPPGTDTLTPNSALFVLVISPTEGFRGQVALETPVPAGAPNGCGADKVVEGVMFRLVNLPLSTFTDDVEEQVQLATLMQSGTTAAHSRLRNWVAHLLFGTPALLDIPRDPWDALGASSATPHGGAFADLLDSLDTCDVPLALIFWTVSGIQWVDNWAVRRPVARAASDHRRVLAEGMPDTLGELIAHHFQEHVAWLLRPPTTTRTDFIKALFRYLPAAAMIPFTVPEESQEEPTTKQPATEHAVATHAAAVPIHETHAEAKKIHLDAGMIGTASVLNALDTGKRLDWQAEIEQFIQFRQQVAALQVNLSGPKQRGFDPFAFFGNLLDPDQYQVIPGAVLHRLLHEGFQHPPIDLDQVENADDYNLYLVNENWQAVQKLEDVQFYAVIGHKHLPALPDALIRRAVAVAVQTVKPTVSAVAADAPVEKVEDIGPKRAEQLKKHGIQTVRDLANAAPEEIARILNYRTETAIKFVREAQRLLEEEKMIGEAGRQSTFRFRGQ